MATVLEQCKERAFAAVREALAGDGIPDILDNWMQEFAPSIDSHADLLAAVAEMDELGDETVEGEMYSDIWQHILINITDKYLIPAVYEEFGEIDE